MAVATQGKVDSTGGTTTSFTTAPTVGNVVVYAFAKTVATEPVAPTDNKSNVYTKRATVHETTSGNWIHIYTAPVTTSGGTFTITHPGSGTVIIAEYAGYNQAATIASNQATAATGTPSLSLTPLAASSVIIAASYDEGTVAQTAGTGFAIVANEPDNATHERLMMQDGVFAASAQTVTYNNAVAPFGMVAIAIQPNGTVTVINSGFFGLM